MRTFILTALCGASSALAAPAVLLAPAVGTPQSVTLSGRVLKNAPSHGSSTLSKNLRLLASSNWEGASVEVRFAGRSVTVKSVHDGNFEATFAADEGKPFETGLLTAEAAVKDADPAAANVDIVANNAPFFVISDFDDTIAVTNVLDGRKLVESALLKDELTQPAVEGMADFYECLRADKPERPAFALVSGSPFQYVGRVTRFLAKNAFPMFGLYLRDIGPNTLSNYKQPVIRALMHQVPNKVVLVGDSGEHDPEVYAEMRAEFPGRVLAIYIRNAGHSDDPARFKGMLLFGHPREAARDAVSKGLATKACVDGAFPVLDGGAPKSEADAGKPKGTGVERPMNTGAQRGPKAGSEPEATTVERPMNTEGKK